MERNKFINLTLSSSNSDNYVVRKAIQKAIEDSTPKFTGNLLDIGCGRMPYKKLIQDKSNIDSYTGVDFQQADYGGERPDYTWDGIKLPFEDNQFGSIIATEVLEHCPNPKILLSESMRVLKPGGYFFFTVPFLWPLHEVPHDEFRYTPFAINRLLKEVGFNNLEIRATGGWHASMAQFLGLWAIRGVGGRKGKALSKILLPIIKYLSTKDKIPKNFKESQMILGLSGGASKPNKL